MNTNFTFRDFFVYLIVGVLAIFSIGVIFWEKLILNSSEFFYQHEFIKDFSVLVLIFLIPVVYIIGHLVGGISYTLYLFYFFLEKLKPKWKFIDKKSRKKIIEFLGYFLFRQRTTYAIKENYNELFEDIESFWMLCTKLQVKEKYKPAQYWYVLNELFNSLNIIFFISALITLIKKDWYLLIVFIVLAWFSFKRAKQYAQHFFKTIIRTANTINKEEKFDSI